MNTTSNIGTQVILAAVLGQLLGPLGYLDQAFVPLVLAGPVIVGAFAAARGLALSVPAVLWLSAGLNLTWLDWLLFKEDVAFHLVLSGVMTMLASAAWGATALVQRLRAPSGA